MSICGNQPGITVSFDDGVGVYSLKVTEFRGEQFPRAFVETASFGFSAAGSALQSANTREARRVWAIVCQVNHPDYHELEELYVAWDRLRATGAAAVVSVQDETFLKDPAQPISALCVFTQAPSVDFVRGDTVGTSFALAEV